MGQVINRVLEELDNWEAMIAENRGKVPDHLLTGTGFALLRLDKFNEISAKMYNTTAPSEQFSLKILDLWRSQLIKEAYPKASKPALFFHEKFNLWKVKAIAKTFAQKIARNLDKVKESMRQAGFSAQINNAIEKISQGERSFSLPASLEKGKNTLVNFLLKFSYDEVNGHAFKEYHATYLQKDKPTEIKEHTFNIEGEMVSAQKAVNLLAGRAVLQQSNDMGIMRSDWIKLNFTGVKDDQGNYPQVKFPAEKADVRGLCEKLPQWEHLSPFQQLRVLSGLTLGNREEIAVNQQGKQQRLSIEFDPEKNELLGFDGKGNSINLKATTQKQTPPQPTQKPQVKASASKQVNHKLPAKQPFKKKTRGFKGHKKSHTK